MLNVKAMIYASDLFSNNWAYMCFAYLSFEFKNDIVTSKNISFLNTILFYIFQNCNYEK